MFVFCAHMHESDCASIYLGIRPDYERPIIMQQLNKFDVKHSLMVPEGVQCFGK